MNVLSIKFKCILFLSGVCALLFCDVCAQTPLQQLLVRRLTVEDGLLTNQVYSIHQDAKGLMWFGGKGLQSYDGYRFKTYVPFSFPQLISFITSDVDGNIYFGKGADLAYPTELFKLNVSSGKYEPWQDSIVISGKKEKTRLAHTPITAPDGTVWLALYPTGYAVLKPHAQQLKVVSDAWQLKGSIHYRSNFQVVDDKYIWQYNTKDGIYKIDITTKTITNAINNPKNEKIFKQNFKDAQSVTVDNDSNVWLVPSWDTYDIIKINTRNNTQKVFSFPTPNFKQKDVIHQIQVDKKGFVWITPSGHSGIARYNKATDELDIMHVTSSTENKLRHQYAFGAAGMNLFIDNERNIWYPGDGVQFFSPNGQQIIGTTYSSIADALKVPTVDKEKLKSGSIIDVVQMRNKDIYISYCTGGIVKLDSNGNHPELIPLNMPYDCIRKMFTPDGVALYFKDGYNKKMHQYNTLTKVMTNVQNDYLNNANVSRFLAENDTTVYVGDPYIGIVKYNPKKNTISKLPLQNFPKGKEWLTRCMLLEGERGLWVSLSFCGVYLIDKYTGATIDSFIPDKKNFNNKAEQNAVMNMTHWNKDTLLLCTFDGLFIVDIKTKSCKRLDMGDGLIDNYLAYCAVDPISKNIWINSSYKGLFKYNLATKRTIFPVVSEGNCLSEGHSIGLQTSNGDFLFFFANGYSFIKKDKKFSNYKPGRVLLTDVLVNGKSLDVDFNAKSTLQLAIEPKDNNIQINFSCLDYWSSKSLSYYAYLEGYDSNFYKLENGPQLMYKALPAGSYTLHLKSRYQNGNFCEQETIVKIKIKQVFYKSFWFLALCLGALIYSIYIFLKKRNEATLNLANLKNEQLQSTLAIEQQQQEVEKINAQLTEVQLTALRSQMNPHFIFNSLNSINSVVIEGNIPQASDYLTKFSKLIRLILENSKSNLIPLSKEIEALKLYLLMEGIRFKDKFTYTVHIDESLDTEQINIPPTTLQPFVENAIVHGLMHLDGKGLIRIDIKNASAHFLEIIIDDNGVGRTKAAELKSRTNLNKSHGYEITKERIMQLHPENYIKILDKVDEQLLACGTTIVLRLHY
jgi:sensor histidine kinase YesM